MIRARVVDSHEANLAECGNCLMPIAEGLLGPEEVSDEIGEVLAGAKPGRLDRPADGLSILRRTALRSPASIGGRCGRERTGHSSNHPLWP